MQARCFDFHTRPANSTFDCCRLDRKLSYILNMASRQDWYRADRGSETEEAVQKEKQELKMAWQKDIWKSFWARCRHAASGVHGRQTCHAEDRGGHPGGEVGVEDGWPLLCPLIAFPVKRSPQHLKCRIPIQQQLHPLQVSTHPPLSPCRRPAASQILHSHTAVAACPELSPHHPASARIVTTFHLPSSISLLSFPIQYIM